MEKKYQFKMHLSIPMIIMHIAYIAIACNIYNNGGSESGLMMSLNKYFNCHSADVIKYIVLTLVLDLMLLSSMDILLSLGIKKVRLNLFQNINIKWFYIHDYADEGILLDSWIQCILVELSNTCFFIHLFNKWFQQELVGNKSSSILWVPWKKLLCSKNLCFLSL